jgi:hypothetical protein
MADNCYGLHYQNYEGEGAGNYIIIVGEISCQPDYEILEMIYQQKAEKKTEPSEG